MSNILDIVSNGCYYGLMNKEGKTMKTKATIISIIIIAVILLSVAAFTTGTKDQQTLKFSIPAKVTNGQIEDIHIEPIRFDPVGEKCSFKIDIHGNVQFLSKIKISTDSPDSEPVYKVTSDNAVLDTGDLAVENKSIYISIEPEIKSGLNLEDSEYPLSYTIILKSESGSFYDSIRFFLYALTMTGFSILILFLANRNINKEFDEMQLKARGTVAMNALIVTICVSFGLGVIAMTTDRFPLTIFESGFIITMTGLFSFMLLADIHDAFIGYKTKRKPLTILYIAIGIFDILISGILPGGKPFDIVMFVCGICFLILGIEMIIKGLIDKKEAMADEES